MFEEVFQLANERGRRKLLLDLGNVQYWTRWLFGRLVPLYRKLLAVQGRLVLCNVARDLRDVFQLTKLDRIITIATGPESVGTEELVAELFGPTDREVMFDPQWRTETVTLLAQQMHSSRDYAPMPILADALQDAGCTSDDILDHCRGAGKHLHGCWVVNLVLKKSAATTCS